VRLIGALTVLALALGLILAFSLTAQAYNCAQADGQVGWLNGTTADDAGCITESEYRSLFSPEGLAEAGVLDGVTDNGDGTVSGMLTANGIVITIKSNPLDRPAAATPRLEPDAPTVGQVLFGHPGSGGPQEF
jgi:hypothetical protein